MIKLIVEEIIDKYNYVFKDDKNNKYELNIEFIDLELLVGDQIYIDKKLLEEKNVYTFGKVMNSNLAPEDYIKIVTKDNSFKYERYYG